MPLTPYRNRRPRLGARSIIGAGSLVPEGKAGP